MKIKPEQLTHHLSKSLAPIYLLGGQEPLLLQEANEDIRQAAKKAGFAPPQIMFVDSHFDASTFLAEISTPSLFPQPLYFELRLPEKPNALLQKTLLHYAENPAPQTLLVILFEHLDSRATWIRTLEKHCVLLQVWPIKKEQFPAFLKARLQKESLNTSPQGLLFLAEQLENNLLAALQIIQQLKLLYDTGTLSLEQLQSLVQHQAQYSVYQWVDSLLEKNLPRGLLLLKTLQNSDAEPTHLLWAFCKEMRVLLQLQKALSQGQSFEATFQTLKISITRNTLLKNALHEYSISHIESLLLEAAQLDQLLKGVQCGSLWDAFEDLTLRACGKSALSHRRILS